MGKGAGERWIEHREFLGRWKYSILIIMMIHVTEQLSRPINCTKSKVNHQVNYGLWITMMCQCRFIHCNKWNTLLDEVDNGSRGGTEGQLCLCGAGCKWEISVSSSQFCSEPKNSLKKSNLEKIKATSKIPTCWTKMQVQHFPLI